jgi:putative intracellular protease/amidase
MGMNIIPSYSFTDMPTPDIIVIPGGEITRAMMNDKITNWIISTGEKSEKILSVCTGAFLLAKTGLLNGKTATTISGLIEDFKIFAPQTKIVRDKKYVDNGKIITTAGLSSGIDGALHVVETLLGRDYALMIALNMEYNWDPDTKYARANMADKNLTNIFNLEFCNNLPKTTEIAIIKNIGDNKVWEIKVALTTQASKKEMDEYISTIVVGRGWRKSNFEDSWEFNDENNIVWLALIRFNSDDSTLMVKIDNKGS